MREAFRGLALSLGFLTRLPAPPVVSPSSCAFAWALFWFPGIGALLGALLALSAFGGARLGFGGGPLAAILVALWAALTGALHLDGVADTFDGLSGGRTKEARLQIMKDSRIGAHGATALVLILLLKFALLSAWMDRGVVAYVALIAAAANARLIAICSMAFFRYATPQGLGTSFKGSANYALAGISAVWLLPLGLSVETPLALLAAALMTLGAALLAAGWFSRRLGGLTGDVYGALIEGAEVVFLLIFFVLIPEHLR